MKSIKGFVRKIAIIASCCIGMSMVSLAVVHEAKQASGSRMLSSQVYGDRSEWEKDFAFFVNKNHPNYEKLMKKLLFAMKRTEPKNHERIDYINAFFRFFMQPHRYQALTQEDRSFIDYLKSNFQIKCNEDVDSLEVIATDEGKNQSGSVSQEAIGLEIYGNQAEWEKDFALFKDRKNPDYDKILRSKLMYAMLVTAPENLGGIDYLREFCKFFAKPEHYENLSKKDKGFIKYIETAYQLDIELE